MTNTVIVFYEFVKPHASMHSFRLKSKFVSTLEITFLILIYNKHAMCKEYNS